MANVEDQLKDIDNKDDMIKLLVNYCYTHVRKLYGESAAYEDTECIVRKANDLMDNKEE